MAIDPAFTHAGGFADARLVRSLVAPRFGLDPVAVEVVSVSYVPGRELRVVYLLTDRQREETLVRVDFARNGAAAAMLDRARRRAADPGRVAPIEDWHAVAWMAPEDDRLPGLGALLTPQTAAATLVRAVGAPVYAGGTEPRVLSYVPRRRAVVAFDGAAPTVAKIGRMRDEGACHRRQVQLYEQVGRGYRLPRPLGYDPVVGVRVEERIAGVSIESLLARGQAGKLLRDVTEALVALHRTPPPPGLAPIGSTDLLTHLDAKTLGRLTTTLPALAPRIRALADRLRAAPPDPPTAGRVTLHGDFHPANLIMDGDGPVFIDLDNLAVGPPARDLAIFAGRTVLLAMKGGRRVDEILAEARRLPERYAEAGGPPVSSSVFAWYMAATILARQIANGVRRLAPGLSSHAAALLDLAEEYLPVPAAG